MLLNCPLLLCASATAHKTQMKCPYLKQSNLIFPADFLKASIVKPNNTRAVEPDGSVWTKPTKLRGVHL